LCEEFSEYKKYFQYCFEDEKGAKRYSTELTSKDDKTEVILAYNDKRQVIGQLPRDSFLDSTRPKLVVWGMIFTRDGKLLIHQRKENAKDNQGMWDKSIGGHVDTSVDRRTDIVKDIDTVKAAAREMLEELYKVEAKAQGKHSEKEKFTINPDIPNFLGEWKPEMRYTLPFKEIADKEDDIYFFRMDYSLSRIVINSPRILRDGSIQPVRVFVDLYVFVMQKNFQDTISLLKNSNYALMDLYQLKDNFLQSRRGISVDINGKENVFKVTPDLEYIIRSGSLWEEQLTSFVDYLKSVMGDERI
jgi:isopentenyldiphosphate isomerase